MWGLTADRDQAGGEQRRRRRGPASSPAATATCPPWYVPHGEGAGGEPAGGRRLPVGDVPERRLLHDGRPRDLQPAGQRGHGHEPHDRRPRRTRPAARGGENLLINPFSAYVVNPDKFADRQQAERRRRAPVRRLPHLPGLPAGARVASRPRSTPPSGPTRSPRSRSTRRCRAQRSAATLTVAGTVANVLPGAAPVEGMALQLQRSIDGGTHVDGRRRSPLATDADRPVLGDVHAVVADRRLPAVGPAIGDNLVQRPHARSTRSLGTVKETRQADRSRAVDAHTPPAPPARVVGGSALRVTITRRSVRRCAARRRARRAVGGSVVHGRRRTRARSRAALRTRSSRPLPHRRAGARDASGNRRR